MYNQNYSERPIPLVAVNEKTGKYEMTQESINFLRSVPAPLGIVSVAGLYRTGKSYLLNRMLLDTNKSKQGFGVGPTINPCTKGLWCWGKPLHGKSQNGEPINIIVVDTQGIGALDEDQTHDTKIFTLAILASSCFIYNSSGSIDESAIQSLSLVVNLTKNIQLKSNSKYVDEQNPDQMANYFPTFYWVVRDFTLQLLNTQGNSITSKQYLEKALAPLKITNQYDQDAEQKNRIRKLLSSFFRDRDCFTMVRPIVDEAKLQDLDSIPAQELRPEFIDQVFNFRKRVTQGLKIKTLNGKQLDGDMYCNMLTSYVGAINDGAVPNIQNAWNYMCQEKCQKIQDQCEIIFDKQIRQNLRFPAQEEDFEKVCQFAMEISLLSFREKAIGDMNLSIKYEKDLKQAIKSKIKTLRQQNENVSKEVLQKKVNDAFKPVVLKLRNSQIRTFDEFQKQITEVYQNLLKSSPNLPHTKQKYLELYRKVQKQGADYLFKGLNHELQKNQQMFKILRNDSDLQINRLKQQIQALREDKSAKIFQMDRQRIQLQNKMEKLEIQLKKLIEDKQSQTQKLSKNLNFKQTEFETNRKALESKIQQYEGRCEQISRNFSTEVQRWKKDRQVMEDKIKKQSESIQTFYQQKQNLFAKNEQSKNEISSNYKEQLNKANKAKDLMENQIKRLKQSKIQLSQNLKTITETFEESRQRSEKTQKKLRQQIFNKNNFIQTIREQFEIQKKRLFEENEQEKERIMKSKSISSEQARKMKQTVNQLSQNLIRAKADLEKKEAQTQQKIKFCQSQKKQLQNRMEQMRISHMKALADQQMESTLQVQERQKIRIEQVRTEYITEITNTRTEFENQKRRFVFDIETLRESSRQMELDLKVVRQQLLDEKSTYRQNQYQFSQKIQNLEKQLSNLQFTKQSTIRNKQQLYKSTISSLERQLEETKEKSQKQLKESEQKNKECIIQLRLTYERQRQDIESNYIRQKSRAQKKYDEMVEQYESRHRQQIEDLEEQLQDLKQQFHLKEEFYKTEVAQFGLHVDKQQKEIENLTSLLQNLKNAFKKKQDQLNKKVENLQIKSKSEKQALQIRWEQLLQQFNRVEKELMSVSHQKQRLTNESQKIKVSLLQATAEIAAKNQQYNQNIEIYKKKFQQKQNQLMEVRINYEKQTALLHQQNTHITEKFNSLIIQHSRHMQECDQKSKKMKSQLEESCNQKIKKATNEKETVTEKYEKIKKTFKEIQSSLTKKLNQVQRERAVDLEKISNLESMLRNLDDKRRNQVTSLTKQIESMKEDIKIERTDLNSQINRLREQIEIITRKKLQIQTSYDKELVLARNQLKNQINIKQAREISYNENIRQLQARIDNLQRTKSSDQSRVQSTYNEQRVRIEQSYKSKITESNKFIQKITRDHDDLLKKYDYETKDLREALAIERQARQSLQSKIDFKSNQWVQKQRRFTEQINNIKSQKDKLGLDFMKQYDREKQALKLKLNNEENKSKNADRQKNALNMELERERARFSQIQSNMNQQMECFKDKITKLEKDKIRLDKQNERLKIEKKNLNSKNTSFIRHNTSGLEERKSAITLKRKEVQKRQISSEYYEEQQNKQNISQQILLD